MPYKKYYQRYSQNPEYMEKERIRLREYMRKKAQKKRELLAQQEKKSK